MNEILSWIIVITFLNGLLAFIGGALFYIFRKKFNKFLMFFVSFTTGALLGGSLFHLLPEALEELQLVNTAILSLIGFFSFLFLEKYLHWHHCHEGECEDHVANYLLILADALHNFIDGILIAGAFIISIPFGILTSILILAHELPQEISDFGVLLYGGWSKKKALIYNFLSQATSILGGILGYFFFSLQEYSLYLLPITAGSFIYIATKDLIPELMKEKNKKKIAINIAGIILGLLILLSAGFFVE